MKISDKAIKLLARPRPHFAAHLPKSRLKGDKCQLYDSQSFVNKPLTFSIFVTP